MTNSIFPSWIWEIEQGVAKPKSPGLWYPKGGPQTLEAIIDNFEIEGPENATPFRTYSRSVKNEGHSVYQKAFEWLAGGALAFLALTGCSTSLPTQAPPTNPAATATLQPGATSTPTATATAEPSSSQDIIVQPMNWTKIADYRTNCLAQGDYSIVKVRLIEGSTLDALSALAPEICMDDNFVQWYLNEIGWQTGDWDISTNKLEPGLEFYTIARAGAGGQNLPLQIIENDVDLSDYEHSLVHYPPGMESTPTPTPSFQGTFTPENLVYTQFNIPETATWALYFKPNDGFNSDQLLDSMIKVTINNTLFNVDTQQAIDQLSALGGILVDYDETSFTSEGLMVDMNIYDSSGRVIFDAPDQSLVNWSEVGLIKVPLDCNTGKSILEDPNIRVYHFSDMDPTDGLKTSFEGQFIEAYTSNNRWTPGIWQGHGNAIDIGYLTIDDPTVTPLCMAEDAEIRKYYVRDEWPSGITELAFGFHTSTNVLVALPGGGYSLSELLIRHNHVARPSDDLFDPDQTSIKAGEYYADLEIRGRNNAEIHLGVYTRVCFGDNPNCDPYLASIDEGALILPFTMFISQETEDLILAKHNGTYNP